MIDNNEDNNFIDLRRYPPDAPSVDTIITTRSSTAKETTELEPVEVAELEPWEASQPFFRCSKLNDSTSEVREKVDSIVKGLGYLALAVTLAGAHVSATPRLKSDVRKYLPEYKRRRKDLLSRKPKKHIHQYGESVLSTWETSFNAVTNQCYEASRLLSFLAFLNSEDIFIRLFSFPYHQQTDERTVPTPNWQSIISSSPLENVLETAFETLTTYSLVQWKDDQGSYSMHKLVHDRGHDRLSLQELVEYGYGALHLLDEVTSSCERDPGLTARIVPHIMASFERLRERYNSMEEGRVEGLKLLTGLGDFAHGNGQFGAAFELVQFQYTGCCQLLEHDHPLRLASMGSLAQVVNRLGQYKKAEKLHRHVIELHKKVLRKDHPDTLLSMHGLACNLVKQGKYQEGEKIFQHVLESQKKVLGESHPSTLLSMKSLEFVMVKQGKYKEAEKIMKGREDASTSAGRESERETSEDDSRIQEHETDNSRDSRRSKRLPSRRVRWTNRVSRR